MFEIVRCGFMFSIVFSKRDPAGGGIARYLAKALSCNPCDMFPECYDCGEIIIGGFEEDVLYFDFLDKLMPPEISFYIVASRHSSSAGVKSFTVHHTGNFGHEAPYGGKPRELGISHPRVALTLLRLLQKYATLFHRSEYQVGYEATHHGPTSLLKPLVFIEIGSSLEEWVDPINQMVVGEALREFAETENAKECFPVIGIGGGHYPRKHTETALTKDVCYGHIASKHVLDVLDEHMLSQMVSKSHISIRGIFVEKKSLRRDQREFIVKYASRHGLVIEYL